MKKGAVICIEGKAPDTWGIEDEVRFRNQLSKFDDVQIIIPPLIPFILQNIWFRMISKGITDLIITRAVFGKSGKLDLTEKHCRLPMIGMS